MRIAFLVAASGLMIFGQPATFEEFAKLFQNDPRQPLEVRVSETARRDGVRIYDFSFASPVSGRVPGVLVTPDRSGRFPVVLFGHWMMAGSPMRNHREFLEEAMVYARAGAVCLLLDTPLVRKGVREDPDLLHGQEAKAGLQMAREWRLALDILLVRKDVDPKRVAYVGHSFSASVGAKLAGVEKRIQSFVLMANTYSLREFAYDEQNPEMVGWRRSMGEERVREYFRLFAWDDSKSFVEHSAPAAVFLQNGRTDHDLPEGIVRKSLEYFNGPKRIAFYDAGHALNADARVDRGKWLEKRLLIKGLDFNALRSIEQLR